MTSLSPGTDVTKDPISNKVTYSNGNTFYPVIFRDEIGGLIGSTATTGLLGQSEQRDLNNGYSSHSATSLTVPYTDYDISIEASDFDNNNGHAEAWQDMFFETNTYYWIASRCIECRADQAFYELRCVSKHKISSYSLYGSEDSTCTSSLNFRVRPVVHIPSSVGIEISENPKNQTNTTGTAHVVE